MFNRLSALVALLADMGEFVSLCKWKELLPAMNYSWTNVREKTNLVALVYSCLLPEGVMPLCTLS